MKTVAVFQKNRYRFFYPAGLISLILLPLIGIGYLNYRKYLEAQFFLEVNMLPLNAHKLYPAVYPENTIPERKYLKFDISGENNKDRETLRTAQIEVNKIISNFDTIHGVQIEFEAGAKYSSLVEAFNICIKENVKNRLYIKNSLWLSSNSKAKELKRLVDTPFMYGCIQGYSFRVPEQVNLSQVLSTKFGSRIDIGKQFWPVILLYSGLVLVSIKNLRH